jgi:tRNA (guanosine-2'-O-)-methyltransferase
MGTEAALDGRTQYLGSFLTDSRRERIDQVLEERTRYLTIVLEDVYQPHNASAVLRSCECFGIQDVHIVEDRNTYSVNRDVVLGAADWLDLIRHRAREGKGVRACCDELRAAGYRLVAASPGEGSAVALDDVSVETPLAVLFGTEEEGLSAAAREEVAEHIRIPMFGFTGSFNVSVSAALVLRELTRRIRSSPVAWRLSEEEKQSLRLKWYRRMVKGSDLLEQRYLEEREGDRR